MMAIDPNIALGFKGIDLGDPLVQYGQLSQIRNAQNQNALAQYQLSAAQRADEQQNKLYSAAQQPDFKLNFQTAIQYGAPGIAAFKAQQEADTAALTQKKTQGEIDEKNLKLRGDRLNFAYNSVGSAPTPEAAAQKIKEGLKDGFLDLNTASAELKQIQDLRTPEDFQQYRLKKLMGILKEKDKVEFMLPKVKQQEAGGSVLGIQDNPTMPGYGLPIAGMAIKKTATIGEQTAQGQLGLAKQKFAWEQANPGFEIKEDSEGNMFGVNKRTLQTVPVTVGGGAPAAAPTVQGAGMPGPRMAQPSVVQAIPGMTSVLDQTMPAAAPAAAPVAGGPRQLVGKGTAMTENQSKSAMFGAAMNQANNIISKVEKEGTTTAPVVVSVLQGLARLSPQFLGTGENAANSIESVFRQDPTSLLGPDVNQQKLGQAQIAFATAYLRATSGASFGPSEVSNTIKEYFPLIGEDKAVVKQKAEARQRAIEGMKISTSKQGQSYIDQSGANANDPLGILGGKR
jgi:hypothetical protein